jgi:hypothetical protein
MKKDRKIYSIEKISEEQLNVISKALDVYTRLGLLQLNNAIIEDLVYDKDFNYLEVRDEVDYHLNQIKKLISKCSVKENIRKLSDYGDNWSFGVTIEFIPDSCKRAYEIHKTISHKKWKDDNLAKEIKSYSVHSDEGLNLLNENKVVVKSEQERIIKIKDILSDE